MLAALLFASCSTKTIDLAVTVVGSHDGRPISGASVIVESSDPDQPRLDGTTDGAGVAAWSDLSGEWADVSAEATGFVAGSAYVSLETGGNTLRVKLQPVRFNAAVAVLGGDGEPLPGAQVEIADISATTGEDGVAHLDEIHGSSVEDVLIVTVDAPEHETSSISADFIMGEANDGIIVEMRYLSYDLTVRIVDADGQPIDGATAGIDGSDDLSHVGAAAQDGTVHLPDLPGPEATVYAFGHGYALTRSDVAIVRGSNEVTISLDRDSFAIDLAHACPEGEPLLYAEDFQDGLAQGWLLQNGWKIAPDSDSGNLMLSTYQEPGGGVPDPRANAWITSTSFGDVRVRARWITLTGTVTPGIRRETGGELIEGDAIEWAEYWFQLDHIGGLALVARAGVGRSDYLAGGDDRERTLRSATVNGWPRVARWSDVELIIRDGAVEAWLDGRRIVSARDNQAPLAEGHLGFTAGFGTIVAMVGLDDVVVCGLDAGS